MCNAALLSSALPSSVDQATTSFIYRFRCLLQRRRIARTANTLTRILPALTPLEISIEAKQRMLIHTEYLWSLGRSIGLQPSTPCIEIEGWEHVKTALQQNKGVIAWRMSMASPTPVNIAFYNHGQPLTHLSTPNHLCHSAGWLAKYILSPLFTIDETRYLKERVIMTPGRATGYLPRLRAVLDSKGCVSIVGDANRGRVKERVTMGNAKYSVPTGAPSLAHASGAALLPCAAIRTAPFCYKVIIFPDVAPKAKVSRVTFRQDAIKQYSRHRNELSTLYPGNDGLLP